MIHQQDLHEAIMRSKADQSPISYDDSVVVLRLTRCCEEAWQALSKSAALEDVRDRVREAGCSIFPHSAKGACVLMLLTDEQLLEFNQKCRMHRTKCSFVNFSSQAAPVGISPACTVLR